MKKTILIGIVMVLCLVGIVSASLTTNIQGYYKFDGNANNELGVHNGNVTGATYGAGYGKINGGYLYDGLNDQIYLGDSIYSSAPSEFSWSAWIKFTGVATDNENIINARNTNILGDLSRDSTNKIRFRAGSGYTTVTSGVLTVDTWYFVVATWKDENTVNLYINAGAPVSGATTGTSGTSVTHQLALGRNSESADEKYFFNGQIDEVGFWDRELTSSEVTSLYNAGNGIQYPFEFVIEAQDYTTGLSLTGFSANITKQPSTYIGEFNDTAGSIIGAVPLNSSLYTITVSKTGYASYEIEDVSPTVTPTMTAIMYPTESFTLNFYDEQTNNRINENISVEMGIVGLNYGEHYTITLTNWTYFIDLIVPDLYWITYNVSGYETNNYYQTLNGTYNIINLYSMPTSASASTLQLNLLDSQTYDNYPDVITKLQRYYVGNASWITVQMDKSDEFGNVFFKIIEETINYRFLFLDSSYNILDTTTTIKFLCTSGVCQQTAVVSSITTSTSTDVVFWQTIEANKENGSFYWINNKGNNMNVNLTIIDSVYGNGSNICSVAQYGASGSMPCNVSSYHGYIRLDGYVEGERYYTYTIRGAVSDLYTSLGKEDAGLYTLIIVVTIMMAGLMMGALAGIALTILALIFLEFIGMFAPFTLPFIISAGVIASLIGYKIYKR